MNKSAEKLGSILNYEKLSNIPLLELPKIEKKNIPEYIQCPKYEKAKGKLDTKMERFNSKVSRLKDDISSIKANIATLENRLSSVKAKMEKCKFTWIDSHGNQRIDVMDNYVDVYNSLVPQNNDLIDQIRKQSEKHNDTIEKLTEAQEEAKEALEELAAESLQAIDEDIPMVLNRLEGIANNFAESDADNDLLAAIDTCIIGLRIYAMFDDLIDDNGARKECKETVVKINQTFSNLCANDKIQNYMVDVYRRNLDLLQKNAGVTKQIEDILTSVDQKQLDTFSSSINALLGEQINTSFDYSKVIEQVELDKIVDKINAAISLLKSNIDKAKAFQTVETPAVELGKVAVNADQRAKSLKASMQTNVDGLDEPLTQNHFVVQLIDEAVIDGFYQKDLRVAVTGLRKHIINTIGEANFEGVLNGGDDRFSLKKAQSAIENANLVRMQVALDKIPHHIHDLTDKIKGAELEIQKASETLKDNIEKKLKKEAEERRKEEEEKEKIRLSNAEKPLRIIAMLLCIVSSAFFFYLIYFSSNFTVMIGSVINGSIISLLIGISSGMSYKLSGKIGWGILFALCGGLIGLLLGWLAGLLGGIKIIWAIVTSLVCLLPLAMGYSPKKK